VFGAVVGKAIYEGKIKLEELRVAFGNQGSVLGEI
jgi:phosphoribosylformimino-5-aminoimidazole carboxamide ribonucleotide (ProFAR) isomerase